jgi:hypothetical protein
MAQCYLCKNETDIYDGGDIPICVECADVLKATEIPPVVEQHMAALLQDY